jgi:hypothetical protein
VSAPNLIIFASFAAFLGDLCGQNLLLLSEEQVKSLNRKVRKGLPQSKQRKPELGDYLPSPRVDAGVYITIG